MPEDEPIGQYPIITYTNRLQRQMELITRIMSQHAQTFSFASFAASIRMLIYNFPAQARDMEPLKTDLEKLKRACASAGVFRQQIELEEIYQHAHDWAYQYLFQDAFKFRPLHGTHAHIGKRKTEDETTSQ